MYIYLITNKINGKQYVGKSIRSINNRWSAHKSAAQMGSCVYLHRAIRKYGPEHFKVEFLYNAADIDNLNVGEKIFIEALKTKIPNGYNLTDGGDGTLGYKFSDEYKAALKIRNLGPKYSVETRIKMSEANKGKTHSEETKAKISRAIKTKNAAKRIHGTNCT